MAWTIISIRAPSYVVNLCHNSIFRLSDKLEYVDDAFAAQSPAEQSDNGTPAPTPLPPDITLALTTRHFPKDPSVGFVFGTDSNKCDILLPSSPHLAISRRQFAVTFQTSTGAVLLRNLSKRRTFILIKSDVEAVKLESQRAFHKEGILVRFPGLDIELSRPWADDDLSDCYTAFLARLANTDPNLGAMHLLSATGPSTRSSTSRGPSAYGSEVVIGSGSSAIVYRASHRQTGEFVAIKRYARNSSAIPWKESMIFCTLDHRHIVTFYEFNVRGRMGPELIMEYAALGSMVRQSKAKRFTVGEACTIIKQTLQALQYLHGRRITHRDIKPANILIITRSPIHAKVADFGLSIEGDNHDTFCGTELYAAPEIRRPPYTAKVDIWSVGVMVMELWGLLPTKSDLSWAEKLVAQRAKQASNITTELLDACLQLDPSNRATAGQCLQLDLFRPRPEGKQDQTLFANRLDADGCATVRVDGSIPDTAPCTMQKSRPLGPPEQQGEKPTPETSMMGWNGEGFEPFLAHGVGGLSDFQLEGWSLQLRGEAQPEQFQHLPLEDIPTWNPIDRESWIPGVVNNLQSNAGADAQAADAHEGHLFPEQRTEITHISGRAAVNVTRASHGNVNATDMAELLLDRPGLARMVITGKNVSMQIPGHRINATEVLHAAPIPKERRWAYMRKLKSHTTVDEVTPRKVTWVSFEDGVLLCEAVGLKEKLLPLLLYAGRSLPNPEKNYLQIRPRAAAIKIGHAAGYAFLRWRNDEVAYKPSEQLINVTALLRAADVSREKLTMFMARTPEVTKVVLGRGRSGLYGTYISYAAAETLCIYCGLDPTPVRSLSAAEEAYDNNEAKGD
ncbi:hypothetical protein LLEC1_00364 [Akanthomyces lecanii]|uniref:non-specific serine/threonine protein kinase n=1 Tax=Cordyceps confragosa TaxID=2714763 RepID=A0A179IFL3_CORDF|nr:hypothetical protein LLEC1_00364 [Akanthomyces lecanii]